MTVPYFILISYFFVSVVLQVLTGSFPVSTMAFPLNAILCLIWMTSNVLLWIHHRKSGYVRFMLSPQATFLAIGLLLIAATVIGFTGIRDIVATWPFICVLLYSQTVLLFVILRGWRRQGKDMTDPATVRWRFLLTHTGLLIAVGAGFWGAPDEETLRLSLRQDVPVSEAYDMKGRVKWLDYVVCLEEFNVEYGPQGMPSEYSADVFIDRQSVTLKVNHPFSVRLGETVYLAGFDSARDGSCVVQIVREPWKYGVLVGIVMMLASALMLFVKGPERRNV